jgi:hypothetical protein
MGGNPGSHPRSHVDYGSRVFDTQCDAAIVQFETQGGSFGGLKELEVSTEAVKISAAIGLIGAHRLPLFHGSELRPEKFALNDIRVRIRVQNDE